MTLAGWDMVVVRRAHVEVVLSRRSRQPEVRHDGLDEQGVDLRIAVHGGGDGGRAGRARSPPGQRMQHRGRWGDPLGARTAVRCRAQRDRAGGLAAVHAVVPASAGPRFTMG